MQGHDYSVRVMSSHALSFYLINSVNMFHYELQENIACGAPGYSEWNGKPKRYQLQIE